MQLHGAHLGSRFRRTCICCPEIERLSLYPQWEGKHRFATVGEHGKEITTPDHLAVEKDSDAAEATLPWPICRRDVFTAHRGFQHNLYLAYVISFESTSPPSLESFQLLRRQLIHRHHTRGMPACRFLKTTEKGSIQTEHTEKWRI